MAPGEKFSWATRDWMTNFVNELSTRPEGLTEVRRDGKDNKAVESVIRKELERRVKELKGYKDNQLTSDMKVYAQACWDTLEAIHLLQLDDEQPENEKARLDPDHWYENNLTNASLFANLSLADIKEQLVPGRLFTTRMPRDIVKDLSERQDFIDKCRKNNLKVACVLTEPEEFEKYSGTSDLLHFYQDELGLTVYNRAIPDFKIPTSGDLMKNILDLTYHLAKGENCLVHCAGGSGRTGMVIAAIVKNLGVYDPVARIRKVKSTYVETHEQELFLRHMPKVIDARIVNEMPVLAKAIAAEHLIQVFYTYGKKGIGRDSTARVSQDTVEQLDDDDENELREAYLQTFDLVDADKSGTLDGGEIREWLSLCGAELDVDKLTDSLLEEDDTLTRERFAEIMAANAASSRREYDIGGNFLPDGGHH